MSASLHDLLALPELAGATLLPAGADGAIEVAALITPGAPPSPGIAHLLVAAAPPDELPPECVAVLAPEGGSDPGLPTIVPAPGTGWGEALAAIAHELTDAGGAKAAREARALLRGLATVSATADDVAETAADLLGAPVALLDEHLSVLGASGLTLDQRTTLQTAIESARGHGPVSLAGVFVREARAGTEIREVMGVRDPVGVIVAWPDGPATSARDAVLTELEFSFIGMRSRDAVRLDTEARLRGNFIEELSSGDPLPADLVIRRARHLGAELSDGAIAIAGTLQDPHNRGRRINDERLVKRFLQRARSVIAMNRTGALLDWRGEGLLVLLPPKGPVIDGGEAEVDSDAHELGERLMSATEQAVPGLALTLAFSRFTRDPARLGTAIAEARLAHSIGERLKRVGELLTFEETGAYKLLFRVLAERPEEVEAFFGETLEPVVRYDADNQTDLAVTLATYLENDGNLAATAAELFTHRHTVRYRLDRIADVAGLDVSRSEDREMLSLGLKAMRLLGHPPPSSAARADVEDREAV